MILPPVAHGVKVISIGMFVDDRTAVSWRGPLLHRTMQQFLTDVYFGDLDVLLLDLPPGTGRRRDLARAAAAAGRGDRRDDPAGAPRPRSPSAAGLVARQTGQTVIGVVENMTGEVFGSGGRRRGRAPNASRCRCWRASRSRAAVTASARSPRTTRRPCADLAGCRADGVTRRARAMGSRTGDRRPGRSAAVRG